MKDNHASPQPASLPLALVVAGIAGLTFYYATDIRALGVGDNHDPGPRAFPYLLAAGLSAWSVWETIRAARERFAAKEASGAPPKTAKNEDGGEIIDGAILLAAVCLYIGGLHYGGFLVATPVFAAGLMIWRETRWPLAVGASLVLTIGAYFLFVKLFKSPLPAGIWELSL